MLAALLLTLVPVGEAFTCTPIAVWDGDGPIWCEEGPRIRLAGIAAREIDGSCSAGHPCPEASAILARDTLVALVGEANGMGPQGHVTVVGPPMRCISEGSGGGNRTAAWCVSPKGGDLSCRMVALGMAVRWDRFWRGRVCQ